MLSFSNAKKGGDISEILSSSFEINLFNPACGYTVSSTHIISKKRGTEEWDKCRTNEKARREASLSESVFFVLGTYCCFNFPYHFFGGQETDSKWRTRIGRPSDPQNNHLNLFG